MFIFNLQGWKKALEFIDTDVKWTHEDIPSQILPQKKEVSQHKSSETESLTSTESYGSGSSISSMIGTVYHNYHRPALILIFLFPDLLPKILRTSSQGTRMSFMDLCVPSQAL